MAMADCIYVREQQQLDDAVVHRLLPQEILVEIGIADHAAAAARARRQRSSHAVVEELAARLVGILGLTSTVGGSVGERPPAPPPASAAPPYSSHHHHPHVRGQQHLSGDGAGLMAPSLHHARGFGTRQTLPPPFAGTGVFLPRAEVYLTRSASSNPPRINGAKPPRMLRKEAAVRNWIN
ncbi:uncharacterized protein LOC102713412 [Oryza brachyantha]|uniref:uncharacterized protein LOC102713412 n=1 Tax=Oryza brachyantha TaxID=4533 RepID=UPI001ADA1481|nr:uncharacterized protein LOC102713412 [Oryza brachyantha]